MDQMAQQQAYMLPEPEIINLRFPEPSFEPGAINELEERIDVPYADWQAWQRFKGAPWWKRIFMNPNRKSR